MISKNINLYNKYRPKNFANIVGQNVIKTLLVNSLKTDKFIQSYLFFGPHGTGKTSLARIYAKGINCKNFDGKDVCDKCESCKLINENKTLDIVEIDAASNNGVEFIRELVSSVEYLPLNLDKKVYIIDESHGLSQQSWNSLLKVIEEPPSHIVFIFLTTQEHKILPTILSRCQKFKFSFLNSTELNELIKHVAKKESKKIDEEVIKKAINLSQGSAREFLTIFDQLFLEGGDSITIEHYNKVFSFVANEKILNFVEILLCNKKAEAFMFIDDCYSSGCNLINLLEETLKVLLDLEIFRITRDVNLLKTINHADVEKFSSHESIYLNCCTWINDAWKKLNVNKNPVLQIKSFLALWFAQNTDIVINHKDNIQNIQNNTLKNGQKNEIKNESTIFVEKNLENKKNQEISKKQNVKKISEIEFESKNEKSVIKNENSEIVEEKIISKNNSPEQELKVDVESDKDHMFKFNTIGIYPKDINEYLNGSQKFECSPEIIKTLQICNQYKEDSKRYFTNLTNYIEKKDSDIKNLFISWNKKYELIASDQNILITFDDEKYSNIFNKKFQDIKIQKLLTEAINFEEDGSGNDVQKKYAWYAIARKQLSTYVQKSKEIKQENLNKKTEETTNEKNEKFNKFLDMLNT